MGNTHAVGPRAAMAQWKPMSLDSSPSSAPVCLNDPEHLPSLRPRDLICEMGIRAATSQDIHEDSVRQHL